MRAMAAPRRGTEILKNGYFYLGTYLTGGRHEKNPDAASLFVKHAQLRRAPSGKCSSVIVNDAIVFSNEGEMVAWIEDHGAEELPDEADGNPRYVPEAFRA